ncbi:TPA_asm: hypothetical protein GHG98_13565 [Listeria monocytogenes]|uniref:DUF2481 family protein n=1 Tax=Listeria monocytogenes TaxID=1639 RepID=UPI001078F4E4|nr:DUF2481 family protein [Listeria monocytogenes]EAF4508020.1 DUF2481 domain-containing protein [Listeria monocytogenes serotype 1/2a]EAA0417378.1 DUF2481 domain-containing protein [Listeria monocytogenes]EAC3131519.1 DUF2481 domain-containing protein [Listeria monocytogenes]EAC3308700.1 DUF2481 domain-containing protein [Listeria monocytogenes]EAD1243138.1 DUF2481 domain-containing protein [Listeria monocytogenes]
MEVLEMTEKVLEMTENKERQREIISYLINENLPFADRKVLQKELNYLMNTNTEEKMRTWMKKEARAIVGNRNWENMNIIEFVILRHAGLTQSEIADFFNVSKSKMDNFVAIRENRSYYRKNFVYDLHRIARENWTDK